MARRPRRISATDSILIVVKGRTQDTTEGLQILRELEVALGSTEIALTKTRSAGDER